MQPLDLASEVRRELLRVLGRRDPIGTRTDDQPACGRDERGAREGRDHPVGGLEGLVLFVLLRRRTESLPLGCLAPLLRAELQVPRRRTNGWRRARGQSQFEWPLLRFWLVLRYRPPLRQ